MTPSSHPIRPLDPQDTREKRIIDANRAVRIVQAIEDDIKSRMGLGHQWERMEEATKIGIRLAWHQAVMRELS